MMALPSVLGLRINSFYPETGALGLTRRYLKLSNAILDPREESSFSSENQPVSLLWCKDGGCKRDLKPSFVPNHVVPLFFWKAVYLQEAPQS